MMVVLRWLYIILFCFEFRCQKKSTVFFFKSNGLKCPATIRVESGKRSGIGRDSKLCVYKYLQPLKDRFSHLHLQRDSKFCFTVADSKKL